MNYQVLALVVVSFFVIMLVLYVRLQRLKRSIRHKKQKQAGESTEVISPSVGHSVTHGVEGWQDGHLKPDRDDFVSMDEIFRRPVECDIIPTENPPAVRRSDPWDKALSDTIMGR